LGIVVSLVVGAIESSQPVASLSVVAIEATRAVVAEASSEVIVIGDSHVRGL
jgi:hypothetical protein